jgi:hypothetical protein
LGAKGERGSWTLGVWAWEEVPLGEFPRAVALRVYSDVFFEVMIPPLTRFGVCKVWGMSIAGIKMPVNLSSVKVSCSSLIDWLIDWLI